MKTWIFCAAILTGLIARVMIAGDTTRFFCDDEKAHMYYAGYVDGTGEMPQFAASADFENVPGMEKWEYTYENYQFPAYYYLVSWFGGSLFEYRLATALLSALTVLVLCLYASRIGTVAFWLLPGYAIVGTMVTNQSMEILGAACLAYAISVRSHSLPSLIVLGLSAAILATSKITGLCVVAALFAYYVATAKEDDGFHVIALVPALFLGGWSFVSRLGLHGAQNLGDSILHLPVKILCAGYAFFFGPEAATDVFMGVTFGIGGLALLIYAIRKINWKAIPREGLVCAGCIVAMFLCFLALKTHSPGRLLYAAVPFLLIGSKSTGTVPVDTVQQAGC